MRIGAAAGFKIEYLNKVRLAGSLHRISVVTRQYVVLFYDFSETLLFEIRAICFKLLLINVLSLIFSFSIFSCPLFIHSVCFNRAYIFLSSCNLFQLTNTKTSDNKSTLLHFLVQSIESKCPEVLNLKEEIPSVPTAAKGKVLTLSLHKVKKKPRSPVRRMWFARSSIS